MLPIPFNHFGQGEPFTPPDIINGRYWALPPTGVRAKTSASFVRANEEWLDSPSTDFDFGDIDFSILGWFRSQSNTPLTDTYFSKWNPLAGGDERSYLFYRPSALGTEVAAFICNDGTNLGRTQINTGYTTSAGNFFFGVFVYDSVNDLFKITILDDYTGGGFQNSTLAAPHTGGAYIDASPEPFNIGRVQEGSYLFGYVDNIMVYRNKRVSMAEMLAIYNNKNGLGLDKFATHTSVQAVGQAYDGVIDAHNIDSVLPSMATTTTGTVACWVRPDVVPPASNEHFVSWNDSSGTTDYILFGTTLSGGAVKVRAALVVGGVTQWSIQTTGPAGLAVNFWSHIALIHDGVEPNIYANGVLQGKILVSSLDNTKWFNDVPLITKGRIGAFPGNPADVAHFEGAIDEVNVWNRNLSAIEIAQVHSTGGTYDNFTAGLLTGLVASFNMNEEAGTNLVDRVASLSGIAVGLPREARGPSQAADTTINAGDLSTNITSHWGMNEEGGTRFDGVGSNDLTDNNTVEAVFGIISDPIVDGERAFAVIDQFGGIIQGEQSVFDFRPFLTGGKLVFDGTKYINIDQVQSLIATDTVGTWSAFVKVPVATGLQQSIITFASLTTNTRLGMSINGLGQIGVIARKAGVDQWVRDTDNQVVFDNTWVHVGLVHDGASPTIYIDGVNVAQAYTSSADGTVWANDLALTNGRIGALSLFGFGTAFQFLGGEIHELQIYSAAASAGQMLQLATYNVP